MRRILLTVLIAGILLLTACASSSEPKVLPYPGEGAPPPPPGYTYDLPPSPSEPTPAPTKPALTSAERAYASTIADQTDTIGKALSELGELLQNPQIGNDEWTLQVATQIVIIRGVYDEAMELTPP